ncbi:PIN domain-containing protein [Streptomyces sp. NPDC006324]|uniref:PIN domain-containing protein n=1 Tax=Streptomyces sp. NPDC006324 TaxID=3156751 RepID=UPI0033A407BA
MLRLLGKAGIDVAVPWAVLEELTAHKLYDYQRSFEMMRRRHHELSEMEPNLAGPEPKFRGDEFASYWRRQYSEVFTVIPTSHRALQQAVLREAACMKPAKVDKSKKSGGRDVAVWFSVLEYLEENPQKEINFVSANTADFGEPGGWPFPLDIDLGTNAARITHLLDFESALEKFAQPAAAPEGVDEDLARRLSTDHVMKTLRREIWARHLRRIFKSKLKEQPTSLHLGVSLKAMEPAECRKIGESVWFWAKVTWNVFALEGDTISPLIASWDTSILFPQEDRGGISLLRSGSLVEAQLGDLDEMLRGQLDEALQSENEALADFEMEMDEEVALQDRQEGSAPRRRSTFGHSQVRKELQEAAFRYESRVLEALGRNFESVRYAGTSSNDGVDAVIVTDEGLIGVVIKHGNDSRAFSMPPPLSRLGVTRGFFGATLVITNSSIIKNALGPYPPGPLRQAVRWNGDMDDEALVKKVHKLRHALRQS